MQAEIQKSKWEQLADKASIEKTIKTLKENNIEAHLTKDRQEAKQKVLSLIPEGTEIMTMTSVTLDSLGITEEINNSNKFNSVRKKFAEMDRKTQKREMKQIGAAPEYAIGSVHAITEKGEIMIASNTGSQLPAHAYGADKVIFVVGTNKIVEDIDAGLKRIYEHSLPLESERAKIAYGVKGSAVSKILIINNEVAPNRIHVVFVNEVLGY